MTIIEQLARELNRPAEHIENVVRLLDEGNTIPFIARYRKELHGSMDDTALRTLEERYPAMNERLDAFGRVLEQKGVTPETTYLYMHGHTLMDNVVMVLLNTVCDRLRTMSVEKINSSRKQGVPLKNEMSNYINSLRSIRDVLLDNENYTRCPLYENLRRDIDEYLKGVISHMRQSEKSPRRRRNMHHDDK